MRELQIGTCTCAALLVAACGNGTNPVSMGPEQLNAPMELNQLRLGILGAGTAIHEAVRGVVASGTDLSAVSGTWDGETVNIVLQVGDETIAMNSGDNALVPIAFGPSPVREGYMAGSVAMGGSNADGTIHAAGRLALDWNSTDETDYLAGGYWMAVDSSTPDVPEVSVGIFVTGPEEMAAPKLPTTGSATYTGRTEGLHTVVYSDGWFAAGEFDADITLAADFDAMEIAGRIDNIYSSEEGIREGALDSYERSTRPYELVLGPAPIDGGEFSGGLEVTIPADNIATSTGRWDGQFINDGVIGSCGATWVHDDGTEGQYIGAFLATED